MGAAPAGTPGSVGYPRPRADQPIIRRGWPQQPGQSGCRGRRALRRRRRRSSDDLQESGSAPPGQSLAEFGVLGRLAAGASGTAGDDADGFAGGPRRKAASATGTRQCDPVGGLACSLSSGRSGRVSRRAEIDVLTKRRPEEQLEYLRKVGPFRRFGSDAKIPERPVSAEQPGLVSSVLDLETRAPRRGDVVTAQPGDHSMD